MNKNTKISQSQHSFPIGQPSVQGIPKRNMLIPQGFSVNVSSEKKFNHSLKEIKSNIINRLNEFLILDNGWYDGEQGKKYSPIKIHAIKGFFLERELLYTISKPYFYPALDGGISIEWDFDKTHVTLSINMENFKGELFYYSDDDEKTINYDFSLSKDWYLLQLELSKINILNSVNNAIRLLENL